MQVKQLLADVMRMVGRPDAAESCENSSSLSAEVTRMQRAMLLCLNAVADELARGYFPVKAAESLTSASGEYAFSSFGHTPYRILKVKSGGQEIDWTYQPSKLICAQTAIEVEYEYVPDAFELTDEFSYPDPAVGVGLVACGVAAEYMLIVGDVESAGMWESRYRAEIDRQLSLRPVSGRVPIRRWL